jgi:putative membrane protein insertion efficiency factor
MRRLYLSILLFTLFTCCASGQSSAIFDASQAKLQNNTTTHNHVKPHKRGIGNFFLSVYQNNISAIISADCLYNPSCSRFSRQAINEYGLLKGVLVTADRLTRCSAFCGKDIPLRNFDEEGLAKDNP